jgi:Glycosyl transferase family 2
MRIYLHIGPDQHGANRLQQVLADKRKQLIGKGFLFPRSPGTLNHSRLYMATTDADHIDPLRYNRGFGPADKQKALLDGLVSDLKREIALHQPETLILSTAQLGSSLHRASELCRLKALLDPLSDDIRIVAYVDEQARVLARHYAAQVNDGRAAPLSRDLQLVQHNDWWQTCLNEMPRLDPQAGIFEETQGAPFWLDYMALVSHWEQVFGTGSVALRAYDEELFASEKFTDEIRAAFGIAVTIGKASLADRAPQPADAALSRGRQFNALLLQVLAASKYSLPRPLWRSFIDEIAVAGDPIAPGALSKISSHFADDNNALLRAYPAVPQSCLKANPALPDWTEADPTLGFRASQYLLSFLYRIEKATKSERRTKTAALSQLQRNAPVDQKPPATPSDLSATARALLPPLAVENYAKLKKSPFAPHNRMGTVNETTLVAPYTEVPKRALPDGATGNVIVGCMKDEAPYIVEWVAYHRAIGVDNFLIYTNDCSDGTSEMLDRLQDMGVLQHRSNDGWKGKSPQQYALNQSLKEPVIKNADWIAHIDVDEFMNVRTGNGTLQDFFDAVPDATNVAMTWRLFGHNNVTQLSDAFVIDQFDTCAPKYCPKPHTVWGFKTIFKNIGAYEKISCHRPNKLRDGFQDTVHWVNGSGKDMTKEAADKGWRNSRKSIGYDLLQLNHYALRSAESYLIKRQRGRALHVDRSIGLNYWIRMDWSDFHDVTIKRNLPRLRAEYDRLMADDTLHKMHQSGLNWHRTRAIELHANPEFEDLYQQALKIKLNETERVAYALALDMES